MKLGFGAITRKINWKLIIGDMEENIDIYTWTIINKFLWFIRGMPVTLIAFIMVVISILIGSTRVQDVVLASTRGT